MLESTWSICRRQFRYPSTDAVKTTGTGIRSRPEIRSIFDARHRPFRPESPRKAHSRKTYGDSDTRSPDCTPPGKSNAVSAAQSEISVVFRLVPGATGIRDNLSVIEGDLREARSGHSFGGLALQFMSTSVNSQLAGPVHPTPSAQYCAPTWSSRISKVNFRSRARARVSLSRISSRCDKRQGCCKGCE